MILRFLKEEKGQGAIEYILLTGGIILAGVLIFAIYAKITRSGFENLNSSAEHASSEMQDIISNKAGEMGSGL